METQVEQLRGLPALGAVSREQWTTQRRGELLKLFQEHVFGRSPGRPPGLRFELLERGEALGGRAVRKRVAIHFSAPGGQGQFQVLGYIPTGGIGRRAAFVVIDHRSKVLADPGDRQWRDNWPVEMIVQRGYATFAFAAGDLDPDTPDDFKNGVHGLFDQGRRDGASWGTLAAWAWGASRVMDYLESDGDVDASRVAVIGHSRGGKTALWAGASDERFALAISNNSGTGGAALARGCTGEGVARINKTFPHWFCRNYHGYGERVEALPVDMHMLIALLAPRHAYVASAADDDWADPTGEYLSAVAAGPAFALFGAKPLTGTTRPAVGTVSHDTAPAYHLRAGGHGLLPEDWRHYLDYADRVMRQGSCEGMK